MRRAISLLACFALLLLCGQLAAGEEIHTFVQCNPGNCGAFAGELGSPAAGAADFSPDPWIMNFITGDVLTWHQNGTEYDATFGVGGDFEIQGKNGESFSGFITGGYSSSDTQVGGQLVSVNFVGQWNNSSYGYGDAFVATEGGGNIGQARLDVYNAPEPSSLMLLVGGVAGLWRTRRQFM